MSDKQKLDQLIDSHRRFYKENEKEPFDRARRFYRGEFFGVSGTSSESNKLPSGMFATKNIIYAIADSAISSLLGPNPMVGGVPRNRPAQDSLAGINGLMEWIWDVNSMRRRAGLTLIDATLCRRGIFKTGWSKKDDRPIITVVDPSMLFYDLTARDVDQISYWLEATVLPWDQLQSRIKQGIYDKKAAQGMRPDRYPKWMLDESDRREATQVRNARKWTTVWEYYDRERGTVVHYSKEEGAILLEDKIDYAPYSMYSLNHSGVDCSGISEVQLVLSQQQTINDLMTLWKRIAYLQIPRILYDAGRLSEEELNTAMQASEGSFVPVQTTGEGGPDARFSNLFFPLPTPESPAAMKEFVLRQEEDAAFISALAESARGQVTGARTATEMQLINAQQRTRLSTKEGHLHDAMKDVAKKAFYLCQKYMSKPKLVRISGDDQFAEMRLGQIRDVDVDFKVVAYNPIARDPGVMLETLLQLIPILQSAINIDNIRLVEEIVERGGLPQRILIPEERAREMEAAAAQAAQQAALGGAAVAQQPQQGVGEVGQGAPPMGAEGPAQPASPPTDAALQIPDLTGE